MDMYFAQFNMDTGCVDAWLTDGTIVSINCTAVERIESDNLYQRSELDNLIYNDSATYVELIHGRRSEKVSESYYTIQSAK